MNFFEIINAALIELNYTPVNSYSELTKLEHKRLMNIVNRLNKEICNMNDKSEFRQVVKNIQLSPKKVEYSISFSGQIEKITGQNSIYRMLQLDD